MGKITHNICGGIIGIGKYKTEDDMELDVEKIDDGVIVVKYNNQYDDYAGFTLDVSTVAHNYNAYFHYQQGWKSLRRNNVAVNDIEEIYMGITRKDIEIKSNQYTFE